MHEFLLLYWHFNFLHENLTCRFLKKWVSRKKVHFLIRVIIGTKNNDIWKKRNVIYHVPIFEKMNPLCANFSFRFRVPARTRWVSFTNYTRLETRIFQTLFLLNIKINFTSGQFWHFFGWRKTMPFRLIFRFERRCFGLSWHKGHLLWEFHFFINF